MPENFLSSVGRTRETILMICWTCWNGPARYSLQKKLFNELFLHASLISRKWNAFYPVVRFSLTHNCVYVSRVQIHLSHFEFLREKKNVDRKTFWKKCLAGPHPQSISTFSISILLVLIKRGILHQVRGKPNIRYRPGSLLILPFRFGKFGFWFFSSKTGQMAQNPFFVNISN